jgi:hypothetical protein
LSAALRRNCSISARSLIARHGRIVLDVYYAPYSADLPHAINSATKAVIGTLTAIAYKDGLLDSVTFNYNSGNSQLLSAIITKLTGMEARDYAKAKLFAAAWDRHRKLAARSSTPRYRGIRIGHAASRHGKDWLSVSAQRPMGEDRDFFRPPGSTRCPTPLWT